MRVALAALTLAMAAPCFGQWGEWKERTATYEARSNLWAALGERRAVVFGTNGVAQPSRFFLSGAWLRAWDGALEQATEHFLDPNLADSPAAWSNGPPRLTYSNLLVRVGVTNGQFGGRGFIRPTFGELSQRRDAVNLLSTSVVPGGWAQEEGETVHRVFVGYGFSTNSAGDANSDAIANKIQDDEFIDPQGGHGRWRGSVVTKWFEEPPHEWTASVVGFSEIAKASIPEGMLPAAAAGYSKSGTPWVEYVAVGTFDAQGVGVSAGWNRGTPMSLGAAIAATNTTYSASSDLSFPPNDPHGGEGFFESGYVSGGIFWALDWTASEEGFRFRAEGGP